MKGTLRLSTCRHGFGLAATSRRLVALVALSLAFATASWSQTQNYGVIYSFCGQANDGENPHGDLIADNAGNLYGTTRWGGAYATAETYGYGTVYEIAATGTETVLHSFAGPPTDGSGPLAGLVRDAAGNLYGTTESGGTYDLGTVFEVSADGTETVLYSFTGLGDQANPLGNLLVDPSGNLYGTAVADETGQYGAAFKLSPRGKMTELHTFTGPPDDGDYPESGLIRDDASNLYGTTGGGGTFGRGTVFEVSKAGAETLLYSFGTCCGSDGSEPTANLVRDASGNLYGSTVGGGGYDGFCDLGEYVGCGTVFKVTPDGQETVLYAFTGKADGGNPLCDLVLDPKGNLYGTASVGGISNESCAANGVPVCGVVFEVAATGKEKVLHAFGGMPDGEQPYGGLLRIGNYLYGTTTYGGTYDCGTVYKITP